MDDGTAQSYEKWNPPRPYIQYKSSLYTTKLKCSVVLWLQDQFRSIWMHQHFTGSIISLKLAYLCGYQQREPYRDHVHLTWEKWYATRDAITSFQISWFFFSISGASIWLNCKECDCENFKVPTEWLWPWAPI